MIAREVSRNGDLQGIVEAGGECRTPSAFAAHHTDASLAVDLDSRYPCTVKDRYKRMVRRITSHPVVSYALIEQT